MSPSDYKHALMMEVKAGISFVIVAPDMESLTYALRCVSGSQAKLDTEAVQTVEIVRKGERDPEPSDPQVHLPCC